MPPRQVYFDSPAAWRAWLDAHAHTAAELWVGFHKRATKRASLTWPEAVDEALCVGWIDGLRKRVDDDRYVIRFTPRKKTSIWSNVNLARIVVLEREGRMTDAGRAAHATRRPNPPGVYAPESRPADLGGAELAALRKVKKAYAFWTARPPWYRRAATWWVVSAKRAETRAKRLATLVADCAAGRTIKPLSYGGRGTGADAPRTPRAEG